MRTHSSSNLPVVSSNPATSNPKRRNRRRSKHTFILEESPIDTMADQRTMAELLRAPTEGYKDLLRACPHHGFTELHQLDTFYNALNPADQDSLNANAGGNLLERRTRDVLMIIENKSKGNFGYRPPEEDERVEETLTDPDLAVYTIKVPPPSVQKYKPPSQKDYIVHQRDPLHPNIPYPTKKMLIALLSNKEKLQELANTPLNENFSAVIQKKLPEKLGDSGKFLIPCGFSELKCKALSDLGASINLMPLSVWKKLGLTEFISTRMTLELANRVICTPTGIARDVFVPVGKFTFPTDSVIVDYESDLRVSLILGRPFLRTARALTDVYGEEMILRDGDERLTLNMRHDTSSYSNQPQKESINLINIFNDSSEYFLEDLFSNQPSGNPTFSHRELTLPEVKSDIFDSEGGNVLLEKLLDLDSTKDLHPPLHVLQFDVESDLKEIEFLLHQDTGSSLNHSIDQSDLANPADNFVDSMPEMVDAKPSTNNEDKIFNPGILNQEKHFEIITHIVQDKKLAISNASLMLEDFDPSFYEPLFFKEVPRSKMLLPFSSENKEKFPNQGYTLLKKFILLVSQNYLIKAIKFSKSTNFSKAR
nr:reverse transcriptase domain-containing protein [Tanacetum cinerariifolium]